MGETGLQKISVCGHHARTTALATLEQRRKQARLTTFCKFHDVLIHIESKHLPSPTDRSRRTTRHTHDLTYDLPSHWTAYRQKTFS